MQPQVADVEKVLQYKIYTTESCGFCAAAKSLMQEKNIRYKEIKLITEDQKLSFKQEGFQTVPQIWDHNGNYVGGYNELKSKLMESSVEGPTFLYE